MAFVRSVVYLLATACSLGWVSGTRCAEVTAPGPAASAPIPNPTLAPAPGSPLALSQAFCANFTLGIQVPRGSQRVVTYNSVPLYQSLEGMQFLKKLGFSHICFSYPWNGSNGKSRAGLSFTNVPSTTDRYFTSEVAASRLANQAGLSVIHRATDNGSIKGGDFNSNYFAWLSAYGTAMAASGLNPAMNLFVPCGEIAGDDNAAVNPTIIRMNQSLRATLPQSGGWLLGVGGAYWQSSQHLSDPTGWRALALLPDGATDLQVAYMCDDYPDANGGTKVVSQAAQQKNVRGNEASMASRMRAFQAHHNATVGGNVPVILHETGDWLGNTGWDINPGNPGAWAYLAQSIAQGAGQCCVCLWDIDPGDGNYTLLGHGVTELSGLSSAIQSALVDASNTIKAQSYFGNGAIR